MRFHDACGLSQELLPLLLTYHYDCQLITSWREDKLFTGVCTYAHAKEPALEPLGARVSDYNPCAQRPYMTGLP